MFRLFSYKDTLDGRNYDNMLGNGMSLLFRLLWATILTKLGASMMKHQYKEMLDIS